MKGPYERLKYVGWRVWECPKCSHHERTMGSVTYQVCSCQRQVAIGDVACMKLVEDGIRRASSRSECSN